NHGRARLDDVIEAVPLADDDVAALARPDDRELACARHLIARQVAVYLEEFVLPPGLHTHMHDVHGSHPHLPHAMPCSRDSTTGHRPGTLFSLLSRHRFSMVRRALKPPKPMPDTPDRPQPQPGILAIAPYQPGKSRAAPGKTPVKLSANESPLGASPDR